MTKENINGKKGFTIIEVVLVLAIAGLIFLMVFVALPALQRSQRDTQRRQDYSDLSAAVSSYSTNNNGNLHKLSGATAPTGSSCNNLSAQADRYINKDGADPTGTQYQLEACTFAGWNTNHQNHAPEEHEVFVVTHADCSGNIDGNDAPGNADSNRKYVIYGYLEGGNQSFCTESQ